MSNPFVHSGYPRFEDDNYQTVDARCVYGFLQHFQPRGVCIDVCAPGGSGIVDALTECGYDAHGIGDAFVENVNGDWVITNPPYKRGLVDDIVKRQIKRVADKEILGFAALLRSYFDHAKGRAEMFDSEVYLGQIKLRFRPWWTDERKAVPIHNYVWHVWMDLGYFSLIKSTQGPHGGFVHYTNGPFVWYASGEKP